MNAGADSAETITRMSLEAIKVSAEVALKAGGAATKNFAVLIYAMINDKKKVRGKTSLDNLLKSDKELKVLAIRSEDLKTFCDEAKNYGVLYAVLKEKNNKSGICDIMVKAEDAAKITRIIDKFELATIDTKAIRNSILANSDRIPETDKNDEKAFEDLQEQIMDELSKKNRKEKENQSEDISTEKDSKKKSHGKKADKADKKPSVRKELNDIKNSKAKKSYKGKNNQRKKRKDKSR